jgi:hypothetical protein
LAFLDQSLHRDTFNAFELDTAQLDRVVDSLDLAIRFL